MKAARRKARRIGLAHRTTLAAMGGVLAVIPAALASGGTETWSAATPVDNTLDIGPIQGVPPEILRLSVNGELPQPPEPVPAEELPSGPLGIPGTALKAYRNAADLMAIEQPACHIDWALIASIGRIESNHARGGYVDANGTTREPILGPQLNGVGPVAAIPDTDGGRWDRDTVWDRAVGPTQFIPTTWNFYGADGNHDGVADPNNIYDSTLATARYLCSGGLDLADPAQLRAAIYRYNNSDAYVETVIRWADAYRSGVAVLSDSEVPVGAPSATAVPTPPAVIAPPSIVALPPTPTSPAPTTSASRTDIGTTTTTGGTTTTTPPTTTTTAPTDTSPTCESTTSPTPTTPTTPTSETPSPCDPSETSGTSPTTEPTTGPTP
ncbi:hypothetical protein HNR02_002785 [Amycolatopsis endophytica]|uniref:Transglycosylase SLT domain-containing protein n=1 Tax=Amycolatopsis endophytica TaxID=860233 RepID=A0A853B3P7_9PSEU|nr:lytic murein transglycosylase [Amycolatopsis endophytica]NYI89462.1 hypothetical protein [Amycolatopsis endophytica]